MIASFEKTFEMAFKRNLIQSFHCLVLINTNLMLEMTESFTEPRVKKIHHGDFKQPRYAMIMWALKKDMYMI